LTAVLLACASAVLFAAATVAIRLGLGRLADAALAALVMSVVAFAVAGGAAALTVRDGGAAPDELWPYLLAGFLAPGASQIFFTAAVAAAGPSRVSVVVGTAPLFAVAIALVFLDEPLEAGLVAGALLIVAGGFALVSERVRPSDFRAIGVLFALAATVLFATRDNIVRWLTGESGAAPLAAAAASLLGGVLVIAAYRLATAGVPSRSTLRRAFVVFAAAGALAGLSYISLYEAYDRGRVSVVSPLVATESLWGVALSALVFGQKELVGRRLVAGAALVVLGGALIGATR
jgi:drug/metabolite transporter (DMT)-like permease